MTEIAQAKKVGRPTKREERLREKRQMRAEVSGDSRKKLDVAPIDGMTLRWVNDVNNRIAMFKQRGWEFIAPDGEEAEAKESCRSQYVGKDKTGAPIVAFLMGIETELFEEDRAKKQAENDEIMNQIEGKKASALQDAPKEGGETYVKTANISTSFNN